MKDTSGAETPASDVLARIHEEARRFFRKARGSHGWDHTERVVNLCLRIGKKEGADLEVLALAAVLHDIGRGEEDRSNGAVCHSQSGIMLARGILKRHGVPERTAARVLHCIGTHRFRKKAGRRSLEAKVLFDADKLDSIGATGIGRAFLFAGEIGARLHDANVDPDRTKPYTADDTAYREYLVKLKTIRDRIFTREGRRIAESRHRFMVRFFDRLNRETQGRV
ncbi:MAG: HD domain-containing protein [Acidobacteriota bacterium]|nr:HD domain-containing protein [Acidobacteriota bacterium]